GQRLVTHRYATESEERAWTSQAYAAQREVLTTLALEGIVVRPEFSYARVVDGFSASLDPRAAALLERNPEVAGIYRVTAGFPAALTDSPLLGMASAGNPGVELPGFSGRGVTIALLDTGVDAGQPALRGRVLPGFDIVG